MLRWRDAQIPHVAARKPRPHRSVSADDRSLRKIRCAINMGYRTQQKHDAPRGMDFSMSHHSSTFLGTPKVWSEYLCCCIFICLGLEATP